MRPPVQRDADAPLDTVNTQAIEDRGRGVAMAMRWGLHADIVMGRTYFHRGFKSRPCGWNAGSNDKKRTLAADAQNALDTGTIHPTGCTQIGTASCRERGCPYVEYTGVAVP